MSNGTPEPRRIDPIPIEDEMKQSFLDYAMSVIVSRALPDVRDGLKPVHRRILYTQQQLSNYFNRPYLKSARVVGDCMGKFHPHGDASIYDALVRMAQDFSMRYTLADGQGNWGSVDGDPAAAMRYTEVRLSKIASELMQDIEKETVDWQPNYDEKELEPLVLPTRVPNLLVNGSTGIAVGMATNIPPHNLSEVVTGAIRVANGMVDGVYVSNSDLMKDITGPDFPTGGFIYGRAGIRQAYETGRGSIVMRGRAAIEEDKKGRESIIITEIPYMVNKSRWIQATAELVKDKKLEGISDIRDESDREGMRVVFELKRDANSAVVLNNLYKQTSLQSSFGVTMIAIHERKPVKLQLRDALIHFVDFRREVVQKRSLFELREAKARLEIVEGLWLAVDEIDRIIALIRAAADPDVARAELCRAPFNPSGLTEFLRRAGRPEAELTRRAAVQQYFLSERQAQAILDMRLQRLTGLERDKLETEYRELCVIIDRLEAILGDERRLMGVVIDELTQLKEQFGDPRRTEIVDDEGEISTEDMIANEETVVTVSHEGYVKRTQVSEYRAQKRGGRGVTGASTREEDFVTSLFVASTHDHLLMFTNKGRAYAKRVYELPEGSRGGRGKPLVNLLELGDGEKVVEMLPLKSFDDRLDAEDADTATATATVPVVEGAEVPPAVVEGSRYVFLATKRGVVKKTALGAFANIRSTGIIALNIDEGDDLIEAKITDGKGHILLASQGGYAIRFSEDRVRPMGRNARGVRGIALRGPLAAAGGSGGTERPKDSLVAMAVIAADSAATLLTVCERGYGKRTPVGDYPMKNRAGMGVITIKTTERNGKVVAVRIVSDEDDLMIITSAGKIIRMRVDGIPTLGRNTQGVRLVRLEPSEQVVAVERLAKLDEDEERGETAPVEVLEGTEDLGDEADTATPEVDDGEDEGGGNGEGSDA